jgi:hypothetical protein
MGKCKFPLHLSKSANKIVLEMLGKISGGTYHHADESPHEPPEVCRQETSSSKYPWKLSVTFAADIVLYIHSLNLGCSVLLSMVLNIDGSIMTEFQADLL